MLKVLLKKQLTEIFRGHYYDAKKNTGRSRGAVIGRFIAYFVVMGGVLGGCFALLSSFLCPPLAAAGAGWLFYAIMGMIAIILGAFGSVFSTYSTLYLAKDNDLLLSMPIPVQDIMISRLLSVYLMGLLYSGTVMVPAFLVAGTRGMGPAGAVGGFLLWILISIFVLVLSCLLGFGVAKASLKLKNKSITRAAFALVFIAAYYLIYFRAQIVLRELIARVSAEGVTVTGPAWILYGFGRAGEGRPLPLLLCAAVVLVLFFVTWTVLKRTFLDIATASGATGKAVYRERRTEQKSVARTLLSREFARFTGSSNYILNCGMGSILLIVLGVVLLIKGGAVVDVMSSMFTGGAAAADSASAGAAAVIMCAVICLAAAVNDTAAPSVSLEGNTLWLVKSLPVTTMQILTAKLKMQMILTGIPALFCAVCAVVRLQIGPAEKILFVVVCALNVCMHALWCLIMGLARTNLNWTHEIVVIKQSLNVFLAMLGGWVCALVLGGGYMLIGRIVGMAVYLALAAAVCVVLSLILFSWIRTRGVKIFDAL
ncbi:MAG: hypothetical protein IJH73_08315 [Lachnospiraceae bacterium]|nr:hypothetical protein [Lachnospiraceae bacterium]